MLSLKNVDSYYGESRVIENLSFEVEKGEILGIVGESGSGKSVTSSSIIHLLPAKTGKIVGGSIDFNGTDVLKLSQKELLESIAGLRTTEPGSHVIYHPPAPDEPIAGQHVPVDRSGEELLGKTPRQIHSIGVSMAFVPEDRLGMGLVGSMRSEERRVGKECRSRWSPYH